MVQVSYRKCLPAIVVLAACVISAEDHFPFVQGSEWEFSRTRFSGGWGGGVRDSGSLTWEVVSIEVLESFPVQYRIGIEQTVSVARRVKTPAIPEPDSAAYDSTFSPPRVSVDTVVLRGIDGVNGLWFEGDPCWSFVRDPGDSVPEGVAVEPRRVLFGGDSLDAVRVDPGDCRRPPGYSQSCGEPEYFTTADGIGPVAYYDRSDVCLMDANWSEDWRLRSYSIPVVGGPCEYDTIVGHARITRIAPGGENRFEGYFAFSPHGAVPSTLDLQPEYPLSAVNNGPGARELRIKTGHVYPCTLRVIEDGTCTPILWAFGVPSDWEGYDTSLIWIEPDSVREGDSIAVHLLSYEFTCANRFEQKSVSIDENVVNLSYRTDLDPTIGCADRTGILYGTSFVLGELAAGTYRVYSFQPVSYRHLQGSDTLFVVESTRSWGSVPHRGKDMALRAVHTPDGGGRIMLHVPGPMIGRACVYTTAGALVAQCPLVTTGPSVVPVDLAGGPMGSGAYVVTVEGLGASSFTTRHITVK